MVSQVYYYNDYYWGPKFEKLHERRHGRDVGITQQVNRILEYIDCDVDWNVFQWITDLVEREVAGQSRPEQGPPE